MTLLAVKGLVITFSTEDGPVRAVDGASLSIERGEVVGVVGESGSGKSVTALSILRLIPDPPGQIAAGQILFSEGGKRADAIDIARASEAQMRAIRGDRIAMIFQDPMTALNPYMRVGEQLIEVLTIHKGLKRQAARDRCVEVLQSVGMPRGAPWMDRHPHELSGGMRQRALIAMGLLCDPLLLIADEPTTAVDMTVQAQILDVLRERSASGGTALLLITHDLAVVREMASRVLVMYAGRIVEEAPTAEIFRAPAHPYTVGLQRSIPRIGATRGDKIAPIPGAPPSPRQLRLLRGCPFRPRCEHAIERCATDDPEMRPVPAAQGGGREPESAGSSALHAVRCHVDLPAPPSPPSR